MIYRVFKLKDETSNGLIGLLGSISGLQATLKNKGHVTFGLFPGLFGLATNEIYWVLMSEETVSDPTSEIEASGVNIMNAKTLVPTVRPTMHAPRSEPGIYVFRWFSVKNKDVDEIARLSNLAWATFEAGFDTEVQGLFAEADREDENGNMLLVTWYRNLTVWQDSRLPDQEARDLFQRRHQLTLEAKPVATRLYLPEV
jgi:hypothetical protein